MQTIKTPTYTIKTLTSTIMTRAAAGRFGALRERWGESPFLYYYIKS